MMCIAVAKEVYNPTKAAMAVIVMLGVKCFQMFQTMKTKKQMALDKITETLYNSSRDEGLGAIHRLVDSTEEQEVKETLLAYSALLKHGRIMTEQEIVQNCEEFMVSEFATTISFEGDDALNKLKDLELVTASKLGGYTALPMKNAVAKLEQARAR